MAPRKKSTKTGDAPKKRTTKKSTKVEPLGNGEIKLSSDDKKKLLETVEKEISKTYGEATIGWLSDERWGKLELVSTGSIALDIALSKQAPGGVPKGRLMEIYGPPGSGKTTLAIELMKNAQEAYDDLCVFIDAEYKMSRDFMINWGVDPEKVMVLKPIGGEAAIDQASNLINSRGAGVCVLDSVPALIPTKHLEDSATQKHMGDKAALVTLAVQKLLTAAVRTNCLLIFINQIRDNLGGFGGKRRPGGHALEHYSTSRIYIYTKGLQSRYDDPVTGELKGHIAQVRIERNSYSIPVGYEIELALDYAQRINPYYEIVRRGVDCGLIKKSAAGGWFEFDVKGQKEPFKIQGEDKLMRYLEFEAPEVAKQLRQNIINVGMHKFSDIAKEVDIYGEEAVSDDQKIFED